jgi:translocator protein
MNKYLRILAFVAACLAIGYLAGIVTREGVETWYNVIRKPSFTPPNGLFAPVWTTLYVMMGIAAGLVWNCYEYRPAEVRKALIFFAVQLALNALWSYLFFGLFNPLLALVEIVLLWLMILETYLAFRPVNKIAAWLLLPYLAWVAFAALLNASIWWLNR